MWVALVFLCLFAALVVTVWRRVNIYTLVYVWDFIMRPWRNRQNEQLRLLALPARGTHLEDKNFGVCPGMIPAELFPLDDVQALTRELQQAHNQIAGELGGLLARGERGRSIRDVDERLVRSFGDVEAWRTIWLQFLHDDAGDLDQLPTLRRILDKYRAHIGMAFVSILPAHTVIPPHTGVLNTVLRYHYGLVVPSDDTANNNHGLNLALNVNEHQIRWQNRKAFLFDDTYVHCAFNHTDRQRIILFLDIIRPMPWPLSKINRLINSLFLSSTHMQQVKRRMQHGDHKKQ